jgi:hypothetical protein
MVFNFGVPLSLNPSLRIFFLVPFYLPGTYIEDPVVSFVVLSMLEKLSRFKFRKVIIVLSF